MIHFYRSSEVMSATRRSSPFFTPKGTTRLSALERLPTWAICVPLGLQWLWLGLRYLSLTLPSVANPALTAGGLVGEGKMEYFQSMGQLARSYTAPVCVIRATGLLHVHEVHMRLTNAGLSFPLIVKPDLGLCGYGVRKVVSLAELMTYLAAFPQGEDVVVQAYLTAENEAGIFYARMPGAVNGHIIGMAYRSYPRVIGDGVNTLGELIAADVRVRRVLRADHRPPVDLDRVPARDEVVRLATIGSTRVGGLYGDGTADITPELTAIIDAIAQDMAGFYVGRFDLRFSTLAELRAGTGLKLMEVNGSGSEAIHAWDPGYGLLAAFRLIFRKQRILFAIGARNRASGQRPIGIRSLWQLHRRQRELIRRYPLSA